MLIDDVQGVHHRADSAEHEAVIPPIAADCDDIDVSLWLWLMHDSGAQPADDYQVCSW